MNNRTIGHAVIREAARTYDHVIARIILGILKFSPFSQGAIEIAGATNLAIQLLRKDGHASAVLTGPYTALTAAHAFEQSETGIVHRPTTREKSDIEGIITYSDLDLAIVKLRMPFTGPFARVDDVTPRESSIFLLPRFTVAPRLLAPFLNLDWQQKWPIDLNRNFYVFPQVKMKKGMVINIDEEQTDMIINGRHGNSGSGLFSKAGGLITICTGGTKKRELIGPPVNKFREVARIHGIPLMSNG